jgi:phage tail sheath protein FI
VTGTLAPTLDAITDQSNPLTVVVRVAKGATDKETTSNLIGGGRQRPLYGHEGAAVCKNSLGVTPRILGIPELDSLPVAAELASIAQKLRAFAYVSAFACQTKEEAVAYRDNFGQRELMTIWPDFIGWDTVSNAESTLWAGARGLRAARQRSRLAQDAVERGRQWRDGSFQGCVLGSARPDHRRWLSQPERSHDAGEFSGFRFWGSRTCSSDPLFAFENYTRTAQVLADTMAEAHLGHGFADAPIAGAGHRKASAKLRSLTRNGYLLGGEAWYDPEFNTKDTLKAGQLGIDYDYTPVPPWKT